MIAVLEVYNRSRTKPGANVPTLDEMRAEIERRWEDDECLDPVYYDADSPPDHTVPDPDSNPDIETDAELGAALDAVSDLMADRYTSVDQLLAARATPMTAHYDDFKPDAEFAFKPMVQAHMYRLLAPSPGYSHRLSYDLLARRLERSPDLATNLGFDPEDTPSERTLRQHWWMRFHPAFRETIRYEAALVAVRAIEFDVPLREDVRESLISRYTDDDVPEPDTPSKVQVQRESKQRAANHLMDMVGDDLADYGRAHNSAIDASVFRDFTAYLSVEGVEPNDNVEHFLANSDHDQDAFDPEAYRKAVRKMEPDPYDEDPFYDAADAYGNSIAADEPRKDIDELFQDSVDVLLDEAKTHSIFDRPVLVSIDDSDIPYHYQGEGDPPEYLMGTYTGEASHRMTEMTASAEYRGRTIKLARKHIDKGQSQAEAAIELLERVQELVNIGAVLWDRWFSIRDLMKWCDHNNVWFLGRAKANPALVDQIWEDGDGILRTTRYATKDKDRNEYGVNVIAEPEDKYLDVDKTPFSPDELEAVLEGADGPEDLPDAVFDVEDDDSGQETTLAEFGAGDPDDDDGDGDNETGMDAEEKEGEFDWFILYTNYPVQDQPDRRLRGHLERFRRRWTIETQYRIVKNDFMAATRTQNYVPRRYYWNFALLMYNLWSIGLIIQDRSMRDRGVKPRQDRPTTTARSFGHGMFLRSYG